MAENYFGKDAAVTRRELIPTENVECPLCDRVPVEFAIDYQGFHLCKCPECGLQFQSPRLSFEELAEKVYTEDYCPGHEESANETAYARQLSNFEELIGKTGSVLDVGCGNGSFLEYAKLNGWEAFGADIRLSPETANLTCPLFEGRLPDIDFGSGRFDVIRFNHVLEHLQNPLVELARCSELLNPGGIVFVGVPNLAGVSPRIKNLQSRLGLKKKRWRHYAATHHLYFFTPSTLHGLIARAGFSVKFWETPVDKDYGKAGGQLYRRLIERTRAGSILDFYITPR
ncbi:MAG: class I SAM-dependent methyltransferase [Acidobacteriota bacterium]